MVQGVSKRILVFEIQFSLSKDCKCLFEKRFWVIECRRKEVRELGVARMGTIS